VCEGIDFVVVHWYPQQPGTESDPRLLESTRDIAGHMSDLRALLREHCGSRAASIQVWVTETNSSLPPGSRQQISIVGALFITDAYLSWIRYGAANVSWETLHNGPQPDENQGVFGTTDYGDWGLLSNGTCSDYLDADYWPTGGPSRRPPCSPPLGTPYPTWHGLHLASKLGQPGDRLVRADSSDPLLTVHAALRKDGNLAILLLNRSPTTIQNVAVSLSGFVPSGDGTLHGYGSSNEAVSEASVTELTSPFFMSLVPYSLNALVLEPRAD
jgi:hypothetical protein